MEVLEMLRVLGGKPRVEWWAVGGTGASTYS